MTHPPAHVLILGATGGIGQACAERLHSQGARMVLAARQSERLEALGQRLQAPIFGLDATSFDQMDACFDFAAQALGSLTGAVNCVGAVMLKPAHRTSQADYDQCLALNLTSAFGAVRAASRVMSRQGASLVLISSGAAQIGLPNHEAVAASKAAVEGLVRAAAASYATRKLRVNAVAPGLVRTLATQHITQKEQALSYSLAMHALDRVGEPEDIASMIAWLLDPTNSWVTGQVFRVDGGLSSLKVPR